LRGNLIRKKVPVVKEETHPLKTLIKSALDLIHEKPKALDGLGRTAIVTNQAVTNSLFKPCVQVIADALRNSKNSHLTAVFGPQHGYFQTEQDNMIETPDQTLRIHERDVPLLSLYSESRVPTDQQMEMFDTFIVDLLDVGCRVYTYMLTLAGCMRQAAKFKKRLIVLDRVNPQGLAKRQRGGQVRGVEGNILDPKWESFVGWYSIPMKHGLTMGELARYFQKVDGLDLDLKIIEGKGYGRNSPLQDVYDHCRDSWTTPSPNLPTHTSALLFPAFVSLEGTNVSEGRGTTLPFQTIGAPYLDADSLCNDLKWIQSQTNEQAALAFQDVVFRRQDFRPTFNKHAGQICQGLQFHPTYQRETDQDVQLNTFALGVFTLALIAFRHGESLQWKAPGYEYNTTDTPLNLIFGTDSWLKHFEMLKGLAGSQRSHPMQTLLDSTCELLFIANEESTRFFEASQFAWNESI
jgi:uncharacterized protein YbbC (DUF1343 family)